MVEEINSERKLRRVSRLPKQPRIYIRREDADIARNRRQRPVEIGEDRLEQRAIPKGRFPGATLPERIVFKKLEQLLGGTSRFVFQRSELGGRNFLGGYVIDFLIYTQRPPILLEILGSYWHRAETEHRDIERALTMTNLGYDYHEIHEADIYVSDSRCEEIILDVIGRYVIRGVNEST